MDWFVLTQLLLTYGLPFAERVFQKTSSGQTPTQADFEELKKLAEQTAQTQIAAAALRAGLTSDDPRVKALLDLVRGLPGILPPPPTA